MELIIEEEIQSVSIDDIVNYVFSSPENSNPNVLRSMLSELNGGSSNNDVITMKVNIIIDSDENVYLDKTWQELYDAFNAGKILYTIYDGMKGFLTDFPYTDGRYGVVVIFKYHLSVWWVADSASGYPKVEDTSSEETNPK